jgi:hypothetical protein
MGFNEEIFDFGISFDDDTPATTKIVETSDNVSHISDQISNLENQISNLSNILDTDELVNSKIIEYKNAIEKISMISIPLMKNLAQGDDQDQIIWPASTRIPLLLAKIQEVEDIIENLN